MLNNRIAETVFLWQPFLLADILYREHTLFPLPTVLTFPYGLDVTPDVRL